MLFHKCKFYIVGRNATVKRKPVGGGNKQLIIIKFVLILLIQYSFMIIVYVLKIFKEYKI